MVKARLLAAACAAALVAACGGGGGGTLPPTDRQAQSAGGGNGDGEYVVVAPFQARNTLTGELDRIFPPVDVVRGMLGVRGRGKGTGTISELAYNGGPVQTAPRLYVVFWGASWGTPSGDPDGVQSLLADFYGAASGSGWLNTVTQYCGGVADGSQSCPRGSAFVGGSMRIATWNDAGSVPARPKQSQMAAEAARAAAHFGDNSTNASYVIAMPHGVRPSGFGSQYCAYHSTTTANGGTIAWTNLPYVPDAGAACGADSVNANGTTDGVTIVSGHEQAETQTDPQPNTGWLDSGGQEIGDKCAWTDLIDNAAAGGYPTQPLWSNAAAGCVQSS